MYRTIKTFGGFLKRTEPNNDMFCVVSVRWKHTESKFKWLRRKKVIPVKLPDEKNEFSKEKFRSHLKELGISPPRFWREEKPITITCLSEILDPFIPPVADGKASTIGNALTSKTKLIDNLKSKKENFLSLRKIKSYDSNFDIKTFPQEAHDIYVKAHTVLMNKDPEELSDYVTEKANLEMIDGLKFKTLKWKFIKSLEPPVAVQIRTGNVITETNYFAQVTVRFHTKQCLAIYDRFGRLFYGNEILAKDVLEYVVFEKHIVNEYGTWRLHGKIIPEWVPSREPPARTYRIENIRKKDVNKKIVQNDVPLDIETPAKKTEPDALT